MPIEFLKKENMMTIRVNEVIIIRIEGNKVKIVRISNSLILVLISSGSSVELMVIPSSEIEIPGAAKATVLDNPKQIKTNIIQTIIFSYA